MPRFAPPLTPFLSGAALIAALLLLPATAACDLVGADCSGADALRDEHRSLLACAGWLGYVENQVGRIEYRAVTSFDSEGEDAVGAAFCGRCRIRVAAARPVLDVATTIVHEAAHLDDGCARGEAPAVLTESAFLRDAAANGCIE